MLSISPHVLPILLLFASNVFMTFAWNHGLGFALIAAGAFFIFHKW